MQWMVDESELRVIHYTLGPLKPWDWWTSWLLKPVDVWQVHSNSFTQLSLWEFSDIIYSFPCVTFLFPFTFIRGLEKREKGVRGREQEGGFMGWKRDSIAYALFKMA